MTTTLARRDLPAASLLYAALLAGGFLAGWLVATLPGAILCAALASGLLAWASKRFRHVLPFSGSPWYRILAVTVLPIASLMLIRIAVDRWLPARPSLPIDEFLQGYGGLL